MTGKADVRAIREFRRNIESVHELMRFDDHVLEIMLRPMKSWAERASRIKVDNPRLRPDRIIAAIEGIKTNESLRPYYAQMYNQCVVLLVSYFAAAVRDLFVEAVAAAFDQATVVGVLEAEIRISARELKESPRQSSYLVAESIADSKDVSFQDMQSIDRTFGRFFSERPGRSQMINDIILGQGCRHAIVHNGAVVDRRLIQQLRGAKPRTLKTSLVEGDRLQFERPELRALAKEMLKYLRDLSDGVERSGTRLPRVAAV